MITIDGLEGLLLLAAPWLVLVVVIVWSVRSRLRAVKDGSPAVTGRYGTVLDGSGASAAALPQPAPAATAARPSRTKAQILAEISSAETGSAELGLPELYLELAQREIAEGDPTSASERLRKCVILATKIDLKPVHAAARLELGDLARRNGDLTTACEHWQMARLLFHQLKFVRGEDAADKRMQSNGCPTDWVLTDF